MHKGILSRWLNNHTVIGHAVRAAAVVRVVRAVLTGGRLSLTHLGRHLGGTARVKHQIKAVDRLLGNPHLQRERGGIYRAIARTMLHENGRPVIVVDWSDFQLGRQCVMLKAALPIGGRAISLYERAFPFKRYNSPEAHGEFLRELHALLPQNCRPIVITDAGFRGPWFRQIESYGWDWVGRVRNKIKYFCEQSGRWCLINRLYSQATTRMRYLGEVTLSRQHGYRFRMYLMRAHKTRTKRPTRRRPKHHHTTLYRRRYRVPWLLATSLPHQRGSERRIKQLYAKRMQIEETFRDLKSHRWGFGLRYALSCDPKRLEILLLLGALATLVAWLVGLAAQNLRVDRHFQANTEHRHRVLSTVFVGRQFLSRLKEPLPSSQVDQAIVALRKLVFDALPA
ncbi:MAG: IS4 family transposase [Polyangiaceae bacterium]